MREMRNCSRCGTFFDSDGWVRLCPVCFKQDEEEYDRIRSYLYEHPGAKVFEVSVVLDISVHTIKRFLREGRLEIIEKDNAFLKCEECGKPVCSGTYCDDCLKKTAHDFKGFLNTSSSQKLQHNVNFITGTGSKKKVSVR